MTSFIRAMEIWTPGRDRRGLTLNDALYRDCESLRIISEKMTFAFDEGLPGRTWCSASPQILTDLTNSYFMRKEQAEQAGLHVAIGIPVFSGEFLLAVIVLLCGGAQRPSGAVELWTKSPERPDELSLEEGYYGPLGKLETASRKTRFEKGDGLPGTVWEYGIPMAVDTSDSAVFKRAGAAGIEGITSALALPFINYMDREYILTFLSTCHLPMLRRCDIWLPDREHARLFLHVSKCPTAQSNPSKATNPSKSTSRSKPKCMEVDRYQGLIGTAWNTGIPVISADPVGDGLVEPDAEEKPSAGLVLPIIVDGFLRSIVVLIL